MYKALFISLLGFLLLGNGGGPTLPPLQYQKSPLYVKVWFLPLQYVQPACIDMGLPPPDEGKIIVACHIGKRNLTVMPDPCTLANPGFYAKLQCHENGHANGWKHKISK